MIQIVVTTSEELREIVGKARSTIVLWRAPIIVPRMRTKMGERLSAMLAACKNASYKPKLSHATGEPRNSWVHRKGHDSGRLRGRYLSGSCGKTTKSFLAT